MKHYLLTFALFGALAASAQTFTVDEISYKVLDADQATVSVERKTPTYTGDIVIPASVSYDGTDYSVVAITQSSAASTTDGAFANCTGLTSVTLPETLVSIGNYSFNGCTALSSLSIPESVNTFGVGAFQNCTAMTEINMPKQAESLSKNLFKGCSKLTSLAIPEGITTLPEYVLYGLTELKSYSLPSTLTAVEQYNFYSCKAIESIKIPEGVTTLGQYFGADCTALTKVEFPSTLTTLGKYSFWKSNAVTYFSCAAVEPPVATSAFYAWTNVYPNCTLYVPKESIDAYKEDAVWKLFTNIEELLPPPAEIDTDFTIDGISYIVKENTDRLAVTVLQLDDPEDETATYSGNITIPETVKYKDREYTVTAIGIGAFYSCKELTSVSMPTTIESIGDYAFARCEALTSFGTLPAALTTVGPRAFIYTAALKGVEVAEGNTHFVAEDNILYAVDDNGNKIKVILCAATSTGAKTIPEGVTEIEYAAFAKCEQVSAFTLPSTLSIIGDYAFDGCTRIYELTIPDNVTSIGAQAFYKCSYIADLKLPENLTEIKEGTFMFCSSLAELYLPAKITSIGKYAFEGCTGLTEMTIPEGCTFLGDHAFEECHGLASVKLPSSLRNIDDFAFINCDNLTSLTLPAEMERIGYGAFKDCGAMEEIKLPEVLDTLEGYAFGNCVKLTSIVIPDGITSIEERLFWGCTSLSDITIPKSVTNIGPFSFDRTPITEIILHEGVTTIGEDAFQHCKQLEVISLPSTVTFIDKYAFWDCTAAREFTSLAINPPSAEKAFSAAFPTESCKLYVPADALDVYKETEGWKKFTNMYAIPMVGDEFTVEGITYRITAIESEGNTVEVISNEAGYTGEVVIPENVSDYYDYTITAIADEAFADCSELTSVTIPATIATIGNRAFKNCTGLNSIVCLGETPAVVAEDAFEGVDVEKVTLTVPESAKGVYENAEVWKEFFRNNGVEDIVTDIDGSITVYDLYGRSVRTDKLPTEKGIYIVNGHKVVIR